MAFRVQIRRDTALNWTTNDPILLDGEFGYETDTGRYKIGNGIDVWSDLIYSLVGITGPTGSQGVTGPTGPSGPNVLNVKYEGSLITSSTTDINFIGSGASAIGATGKSDIFIPAGNKKTIIYGETFTIPESYQNFIYGNFTVEGTLNNYGEVVIANGGLILGATGQVNNLGTGNIRILNLTSGSSVQVIAKNFVTSPFLPLTITHGMGTTEFVYSAKEGNTSIDLDLVILNPYQVSITTVARVTGTITFQSKLI